MNFFDEQTRVVEIDAENSVTVRKITYGTQMSTLSKASKIDPVKQEASMDFAQLRQEQMVAAIVSWDGPGFDNRPVSRDNILALPTDVAQKISDGIDAFSKPLDEDEKKP